MILGQVRPVETHAQIGRRGHGAAHSGCAFGERTGSGPVYGYNVGMSGVENVVDAWRAIHEDPALAAKPKEFPEHLVTRGSTCMNSPTGGDFLCIFG